MRRRRSARKPYKSTWPVVAEHGVAAFQLQVPTVEMKARGEDVPDYVRLDVRRSGLGKLAPRPVLHRSKKASGGAGEALAVPEALGKLVAGGGCITVTDASVWAFRGYRFLGSLLSLFSAVATIIGALLVAYGALGPKTGLGLGLLIAGGVLTFLGLAALGISYFRAPPE